MCQPRGVSVVYGLEFIKPALGDLRRVDDIREALVKTQGRTTWTKCWCPRVELNHWPLPYQGSALPLSYVGNSLFYIHFLI